MLLTPMPLARVEPDRCAFLIMDGQTFTTNKEQGLGAVATERGIMTELNEYYRQTEAAIANIAVLAKAFRARGGLIIHSLLAGGPHLSRQLRLSRLPLTPGHDAVSAIRAELGPEPADVVLTRGTYGPFVSGELGATLDAHRIEWVFVAGMPANLTVAMAAREAADRDYRVIVVQDATASETMEWHALTMLGLAGGAIRVSWSEEVIEMLVGTRT
jgi:nicotinamidase-related amidase